MTDTRKKLIVYDFDGTLADPLVSKDFYPGIIETLKTLHAEGTPQAIVSEDTTACVLAYSQQTPIRFNRIIARERLDTYFKGNKSEALAWMKRRFKKLDLIYVADTWEDFRTAQDAGVNFEGVSWGRQLLNTEETSLSLNAVELLAKLRR